VRLVAFVITNAIIHVFYVQSYKKVTCFLLSVTVEVHLENNLAHICLSDKKTTEKKNDFNTDNKKHYTTNDDSITTERPAENRISEIFLVRGRIFEVAD